MGEKTIAGLLIALLLGVAIAQAPDIWDVVNDHERRIQYLEELHGITTSTTTTSTTTSISTTTTSTTTTTVPTTTTTSTTTSTTTTTTTIPQKIVILQFDDCQAWWLRNTCIGIVNFHIQKQADITVGFVPEGVMEDTAYHAVLKDWYANRTGLVEIAAHTYDHCCDYSGWSAQAVTADMQKSLDEFAKLGIRPYTFIPAFDWAANTADGAAIAGFHSVLDALENPYDEDFVNGVLVLEDGVYCGDGTSSCANRDWSTYLKSRVDAAINRQGYAVILFHQQDFGNYGSSQYNNMKNKWSGTIDKMKAEGYTFMTADEYYKILKG